MPGASRRTPNSWRTRADSRTFAPLAVWVLGALAVAAAAAPAFSVGVHAGAASRMESTGSFVPSGTPDGARARILPAGSPSPSSVPGRILWNATYSATPNSTTPEVPMTLAYDAKADEILAGVDPLSGGYAGFDYVLMADPGNLTLSTAWIHTAYPLESLVDDPSTHQMYAAEQNAGDHVVIQTIDPSSGAVANVTVLNQTGIPGAMVYDPVTANLYVLSGTISSSTGTIGVLDTLTSTPSAPLTLPTDFTPWVMAAAPNDSTLYVAGFNLTAATEHVQVVAIDLANGQTASVFLPLAGSNWRPTSVAFDPAGDSVYVASSMYVTSPAYRSYENVSVLAAGNLTLEANLVLPEVGGVDTWSAGSLTYDPDNADLYLTQNPGVDASESSSDGPANNTLVVLNGSAPLAANPIALLPSPASTSSIFLPGASPSAGGELWIAGADPTGYLGTFEVLGLPPQISAFSVSPASLEVGSTLTLSTTAGLGAGNLTYSYQGLPRGCQSANVSVLSCQPTGPGTYSPQVSVADQFAEQVSASGTVALYATPSIMSSASSSSVDVGQSVAFRASVQGGLAPFDLSWSFGDGATATGSSPTHIFELTGTFPVTVSMTDALGGANSSTLTVKVSASPTNVSIATNRTPANVAVPVGFSALVAGGLAPLTYSWMFGDGGQATGIAPSHTYATAGAYTVTLNVTDAAGRTVSASLNVDVVAPPARGQTNSTTTSSTTGVSPDEAYAGIGGALVVGLVIGLITARRRGGGQVVPSAPRDGPGTAAPTSSTGPGSGGSSGPGAMS